MNNNGKMFGFGLIGFFIGGFIGFLLRPSAMLVGQLSLDQVISRGANFKGLDIMLVPLAQTSFNIMLAGALICGIVGMLIGKKSS